MKKAISKKETSLRAVGRTPSFRSCRDKVCTVQLHYARHLPPPWAGTVLLDQLPGALCPVAHCMRARGVTRCCTDSVRSYPQSTGKHWMPSPLFGFTMPCRAHLTCPPYRASPCLLFWHCTRDTSPSTTTTTATTTIAELRFRTQPHTIPTRLSHLHHCCRAPVRVPDNQRTDQIPTATPSLSSAPGYVEYFNLAPSPPVGHGSRLFAGLTT